MGKHRLYGDKLKRARKLYDLGVPADEIARELRVKKWRVYAMAGIESRIAARERMRLRIAAEREASRRRRIDAPAPSTEPCMRDLLQPVMPERRRLQYERRELHNRMKKKLGIG